MNSADAQQQFLDLAREERQLRKALDDLEYQYGLKSLDYPRYMAAFQQMHDLLTTGFPDEGYVERSRALGSSAEYSRMLKRLSEIYGERQDLAKAGFTEVQPIITLLRNDPYAREIISCYVEASGDEIGVAELAVPICIEVAEEGVFAQFSACVSEAGG